MRWPFMTTKWQKFDDDRFDLELEQIIADMRLKNRQHDTEIWKVVLLTAIATASVMTVALKWQQILGLF